LLTAGWDQRCRVVVGAEAAPRIKENIMNKVIRRLTAGLVTAVVGTLAAAAAVASPASAGVIIHDGGGEPTSGTSTDQATVAFPPGPSAADYPPGPSAAGVIVHDGARGAIIPCL
jgi:hypothetical protein